MTHEVCQGKNTRESTQSEADRNKLLKKFVVEFVSVFENYFCEYYNRLKNNTPKSGKWAEFFNEFFEVGKGGNEAIGDPISKAATIVSANIIQKVISGIGANYNKNQLEKLTKKLYWFRDSMSDVRRMLIESGIDVFRCFESQFMQAESCGCPERAMELLAETAVQRVINFIKKLPDDEFSFETITKGVVLGSSKRGTYTFANFIPNLLKGYNLKRKSSNDKWNTNEIFNNTGLVMKNSGDCYAKVGASSKYGYRILFSWEEENMLIEGDELTFEMEERNYKKLHNCINGYEYSFTQQMCKEKLQMIVNELEKSAIEIETSKTIQNIVKEDVNLLFKNINKHFYKLTTFLEDIKNQQHEINRTSHKNLELTHKNLEVTNENLVLTKEIHEIVKQNNKQESESLKLWFDVRHLVNNFKGRVNELNILHDKIQRRSKSKTITTRMTVICGLGGIGKTELAIKYIHQYHEDYDNNIVWINATNKNILLGSFQRLAAKLGITKTAEDVYEHARYSNQKSLFVFDNAESTDEFYRFLPQNCIRPDVQMPNILITSRDRDWRIDDVEVMDLKALLPEESMMLVKTGLGIVNEDDDKVVRDLVEELQHFPLALHQAIAYIKYESETDTFGVSDYLKKYKEEKSQLLDFKPCSLINGQYEETTFTTWQITKNKIAANEEYGQLALKILFVSAYCDPDYIERNMFLSLCKNEERTLKSAVRLLVKYSIVNANDKQTVLNVHKLVQEVTRIKIVEVKTEEDILKTTMQIIHDKGNEKHYAQHFIYMWSYASQYKTIVETYYFKVIPGVSSYELSPLHFLSANGKIESIKNILSHFKREDIYKLIDAKKFSIRLLYIEGIPETPIDSAASAGYINVVKYFADNYPDLLVRKPGTKVHLHWATENGHMDIAKYLVEKKYVKPNIVDEKNMAPLHYATLRGDLDSVKYYVKHIESDLRPKMEQYKHLLQIASKRGHLSVVKYLLEEKHCDPDIEIVGENILHNSIREGHLDLVKYLMEIEHFKCTSENHICKDLLNIPAVRGYINILKFLIEEKGFDPNVENEENEIPLHNATRGGHLDIVKYLIKKSTLEDNLSKDLIQIAIKGGYLNIVIYLIEDTKVDPNIVDCNDETVVHHATRAGHFELLKYLAGIKTLNLCPENDKYKNLLKMAAQKGHLIIVMFLIEQTHFNQYAVDRYNKTPMYYAVWQGHFDVMKYLAECKGSESYDYENLLQVAAEQGHLNCVEYIIEIKKFNHNALTSENIVTQQGYSDFVDNKKPDSNRENEKYKYILRAAARRGRLSIVRYFVEILMVNPNEVDDKNETALHNAVRGGHLDLVKYFVETKSFNFNLEDDIYKYLLHLAAKWNRFDIVKYLITEKKFEHNMENEHHRTPLYYATWYRYSELENYFKILNENAGG